METFGDKACHPERSEGSGSPNAEILRFAQDDKEDLSQVHLQESYLQMSPENAMGISSHSR